MRWTTSATSERSAPDDVEYPGPQGSLVTLNPMDDSTSHDARADAFQITRKGYDRRQVDAYREANEARIDALERHIQGLEENMSELGLTRPTDLAAELDVVGEEVKRILQEARVAAEQMRSRAADDAARWRAEADEESRALRESARMIAYETRRTVWETGSEMLASAVVGSEEVTIEATKRALFTQAEAEREASRLVGDTRRERDESAGVAREEAERLVAAARRESDSMMSAARQKADAAQERARALELRRVELMAELEIARATIAGNEAESASDVIPQESTAGSAEAVTVVEAIEDGRTHWPDDEGSVRIVSAARVMTAEPVDADAMVAEVEAMRRSVSDQLAATSSEPEPEAESSSVPSAVGRGDVEERSDDAGGEGSDQLPATSRQPEPETEPEPETKPDPLVGLFARLREPVADETPASELSSSPLGGSADEGGGGGQESDQSPPISSRPEPEAEPEPAGDPSTVEQSDDGTTPEKPGLDPFALRERHLLPVQNRALRSVKRSLVEAQNRALEDLRLVEGWEPDASIVSGEVSDALAVLARESMVAGFAAAAEMMDTAETPRPEDVDPGDPSPGFAGALVEAAQNSVTRSRGAGAGHRETASSLSRVFRSWRTDEAERRVQFASRGAYHIGVAAALADLGATDLAVTSSERPCRECPANKGSWTIGDGLPAGTTMPPARLECACTIVPSF
jgi:hypothetical protein